MSEREEDLQLRYNNNSEIVPQVPKVNSSTTKNEQAPNNSSISIAREKTQITSALRLKSGRSNLPSHLRSVSMSCSDKICKWMVLGLQGHGILNYFLSKPIMLSSVVVSHDIRAKISSQKEALERALLQRALQTFVCME